MVLRLSTFISLAIIFRIAHQYVFRTRIVWPNIDDEPQKKMNKTSHLLKF